MGKRTILICTVFVSGLAFAQTSTSYRIDEYAFNSGSVPSQGIESTLTSFHITAGSIGDTVAAIGLSSSSFVMDAGFGVAYRPPGEVAPYCGTPSGQCLRFIDGQTLEWPAEGSAAVYSLYRGPIGELPTLGFGDCVQTNLAVTTTTDADPVPSAAGFFYLITVTNHLGEEGTKGAGSNGTERLGAGCP